MFEQPRWLEASCTLTIPRVGDITEHTKAIYEHLRDRYKTPLLAEIPNEIEPQFPRLLLPSIHGNSAIQISQVTLGLQVHFTGDWQTTPDLGRKYVTERSRLLGGVVALLPDSHVRFVGVGFRIQIPSSSTDAGVIERIAQSFTANVSTKSLYDVEVKRVLVVDDKYFSNATVRNFRGFSIDPAQAELAPLPAGSAVARGVEVVIDFNDRHAFNERCGYRSSMGELEIVLNGAMSAAVDAIQALDPKS